MLRRVVVVVVVLVLVLVVVVVVVVVVVRAITPGMPTRGRDSTPKGKREGRPRWRPGLRPCLWTGRTADGRAGPAPGDVLGPAATDSGALHDEPFIFQQETC